MRIARQNKILELIENNYIGNQKELAEHLRKCGYDVTQATISRDIKELQLVKTLTPEGGSRYTVLPQQGGPVSSRFHDIFRNTVKSVQKSENIIIVKCMSGCANAVGEAIDTMGLPHVIGSVAGDNTLLLVTDVRENSEEVCDMLQGLLEKPYSKI